MRAGPQHDKPTRILRNAASINHEGDRWIARPVSNLLLTGAFAALSTCTLGYGRFSFVLPQYFGIQTHANLETSCA
jgi:hypothetical protein